MSNTAANVLVGTPNTTGGVAVGPKGATLPTDPTTALDASIPFAGYVSEDGVVESNGDTIQNIVAWNGDTVAVVRTAQDVTYKFTCIETADVPLKLYHSNDAVSTEGGITTVTVKGGQPDENVVVIQVKSKGRPIRLVIPNGIVSAHDDISYKGDSAIGYGVTVTCLPDDDGVKVYKYIGSASDSSSSA